MGVFNDIPIDAIRRNCDFAMLREKIAPALGAVGLTSDDFGTSNGVLTIYSKDKYDEIVKNNSNFETTLNNLGLKSKAQDGNQYIFCC